MKLLAIQMMTITGMVFACTTTEAWVLKKNPTGGMIGYSQGGLFTSRKDILADFKKAAKQICNNKKYLVVREIFPAPSEAGSSAISAANKDYSGAIESASGAGLQAQKAQAARISPDSKIEWGNPFLSYNEAEIKCVQ